MPPFDFEDFRGLQVANQTPNEQAGQVVDANMKELAQRAGPIADLAIDPTTDHDSADTAGFGKKFYQHSKIRQTVTKDIWECFDATPGVALWKNLTSGGGAWNKIEQLVAANQATIEFITGITATHEVYVLVGSRVRAATDQVEGQIRTSDDGGSSYKGSYRIDGEGITTNISALSAQNHTHFSLSIFGGSHRWGNAANESGGFFLKIYSPAQAVVKTILQSELSNQNLSGIGVDTRLTGLVNNVSADNAIEFSFSAGNIVSGIFTLYGLTQ